MRVSKDVLGIRGLGNETLDELPQEHRLADASWAAKHGSRRHPLDQQVLEAKGRRRKVGSGGPGCPRHQGLIDLRLSTRLSGSMPPLKDLIGSDLLPDQIELLRHGVAAPSR